MAFLVTRGLGKSTIGQDTTFVATSGLGRGVQAVVDKIKSATHDKFNDLTDYLEQARKEDEELLVICRGFIEIICR
jgi:hypothetical protein